MALAFAGTCWGTNVADPCLAGAFGGSPGGGAGLARNAMRRRVVAGPVVAGPGLAPGVMPEHCLAPGTVMTKGFLAGALGGTSVAATSASFLAADSMASLFLAAKA